MPLNQFYTSRSLSRPLAGAAAPHDHGSEMAAALAKSGEEFRQGDTAVVYMANKRPTARQARVPARLPRPCSGTRASGSPIRASACSGVEAGSLDPEGEPNFQAHLACAERGITHIECRANLDKLCRPRPLPLYWLPLRIRGGTASPIRAVAVFE